MTVLDEKEKTFPYVSIVVPVFNGEKTIRKCIKSLLAQNYPMQKREILVVDNNSTDKTVEFASQFPVRILFEKEVQGSYAARNLGIKHSKGQIIAFTDATCRAEKDWLKNLIVGFNSKEVGCVGGILMSERSITFIQEFCHDIGTHKTKRDLQKESQLFVGGNVAIKKEVFEKLGLFDNFFVSGGDGEYSYRILLDRRFKIRFKENAKVYYSYRSNLKGLLKQAYKYGKGIAHFRLKYYGYSDMNKSISVLLNTAALIQQLTGILLIPRKIVREYMQRKNSIKAFAYPIIDKLHSLWFHAGIVMGLMKYRRQKRSYIPPLFP